MSLNVCMYVCPLGFRKETNKTDQQTDGVILRGNFTFQMFYAMILIRGKKKNVRRGKTPLNNVVTLVVPEQTR
ncbi:hypothetical protein AOLI_G00071680 [Acnodon oligacanthus]